MGEQSGTDFQACIERMNAGDTKARDELLQHASGRLERLARKMLQDFPRVHRWEDTADVMQNAVLRLLQALKAVKIGSAGEFFRLAALEIRRELLDLTRHYYGPDGLGANQATGIKGDSGQETPPPAHDPSDSTFEPSKLAAWTQFHQQAEALPEEERNVFDLLWYQDLTQSQAAQILHVSVPTIKRRWLSARLHLQAAMKTDFEI